MRFSLQNGNDVCLLLTMRVKYVCEINHHNIGERELKQ